MSPVSGDGSRRDFVTWGGKRRGDWPLERGTGGARDGDGVSTWRLANPNQGAGGAEAAERTDINGSSLSNEVGDGLRIVGNPPTRQAGLWLPAGAHCLH